MPNFIIKLVPAYVGGIHLIDMMQIEGRFNYFKKFRDKVDR